MESQSIEDVLAGESQWTQMLHVDSWSLNVQRYFEVDIGGEFVGTLTLQVSRDNGKNWIDSGDVFTGQSVHAGRLITEGDIRIGFKTGAYVSGSAVVRMAQ